VKKFLKVSEGNLCNGPAIKGGGGSKWRKRRASARGMDAREKKRSLYREDSEMKGGKASSSGTGTEGVIMGFWKEELKKKATPPHNRGKGIVRSKVISFRGEKD